MTILEPGAPTVYEQGEDLRAQAMSTVKESLPVFYYMRDSQQIVTFQARPEDGLPTEQVLVEPYYFNRTDPKELGAWKISQIGYESVYLSSRPNPQNGSVEANIGRKINREGTASGELPLARLQECAGLFGIAMTWFEKTQQDAYEERSTRAGKPKRHLPGLNRLLGIGRVAPH